MLSWLFGAENSFFKALIFNLLTMAALLIFGAVCYVVLVGFPAVAVSLSNKK